MCTLWHLSLMAYNVLPDLLQFLYCVILPLLQVLVVLQLTGDEITIRLMEMTLKNLENPQKNCCKFLVATLYNDEIWYLKKIQKI